MTMTDWKSLLPPAPELPIPLKGCADRSVEGRGRRAQFVADRQHRPGILVTTGDARGSRESRGILRAEERRLENE